MTYQVNGTTVINDSRQIQNVVSLDTSTRNVINAPCAYIKFNGTGTVAINKSFNISSLTDVETGRYTVAFSTDFNSTHHIDTGNTIPTGTSTSDGGRPNGFVSMGYSDFAPSAGSQSVITASTNLANEFDTERVYCCFHGTQ